MLLPAAIFDVDGTLCDVSSVRHHVMTRPKNFDAFHAESINCPPNPEVVDMAREFRAAGITIIVVTSRREQWWWHTTLWLRENEVPYDHLIMRRDKDGRPDYEVKKEILRRIQRHYHVVCAVDDNPSVIRLWREEGIPTKVIPGWVEESTLTSKGA